MPDWSTSLPPLPLLDNCRETLAYNVIRTAMEAGEAFLILLTLSHSSLTAPLRVTSDAVTTTSRGDSFAPSCLNCRCPTTMKAAHPRHALPSTTLTCRLLRSLPSAPPVLIEIVRAADPDTVEARFSDFRLSGVSYDARVVEGRLGIEDFTAEPYPSAAFSPGLFRGFFKPLR